MPGRLRSLLAHGRGELTSPPWVRAPLLLFRFPGLLLAVVTAGLVLATASAAGPLFLSSAGNGTIAQGLAGACPWNTGLQASAGGRADGVVTDPLSNRRVTAAQLYNIRARDLQRHADQVPNLLRPKHTIIGPVAAVGRPGGPRPTHEEQLIFREGALDNVHRLSSVGGSGVWITDTTARAVGVSAGDSITLYPIAPGGHAATVRVAGIFRDPVKEPLRPFWCTQETLIYGFPNSNFVPPSLEIVDRPTMIQLASQLNWLDTQYLWEYPVRTRGLTLGQAQSTDAALQSEENDLQNTLHPDHVLFDGLPPPEIDSIVTRASANLDSIRGSVDTVGLAARIVALLLVAAAGMYWVERRKTEVGVLLAKGAGRVALMGKVILEATLPVAAAALAGWIAAVYLVKALGPTRLLDTGAPGTALVGVVWITLAALVLMGMVAALAARGQSQPAPGRDRGAWTRAPWEVAVLALAAASLYEILTRGTSTVSSPGGLPQVDTLLLLFPILFPAGGAGLAARGLRRLLPRLRKAGTKRSPAIYLATWRLASASQTALALVTAVALSVGILVYSGTLARSVTATARAKSLVFNGSDVNLQIAGDFRVPPSMAAHATKVLRMEIQAFVPGVGTVDILGIDRSTFADAAFWDGSFGSSLSRLLEELKPGRPGAPMPIATAGVQLPSAGSIVYLRDDQPRPRPFRTVASLTAFPGFHSNTRLVVMDQSLVPGSNTPKTFELWAKGDPATVDAQARAAKLQVLIEETAAAVAGLANFTILSWVFGFLQALGFMTGLIALGGTLLYLEARQRSREVSYALSRRMGLGRRAHRRSVLLELGGMLLVGFVLGAGLSWIAARLVYTKLDPLPQLSPPALFRLPLTTYAVTAAVLLVVAWIGSRWVQRAAERADVAQVMRIGA